MSSVENSRGNSAFRATDCLEIGIAARPLSYRVAKAIARVPANKHIERYETAIKSTHKRAARRTERAGKTTKSKRRASSSRP